MTDQTKTANYTATLLRMSSAVENAVSLIDDATRGAAPTKALGSSSSGSGSGSSVLRADSGSPALNETSRTVAK